MSPPNPPQLTHELALAVVASSTAPLLLLDGNMRLLAASHSLYEVLGFPSAGSVGRPVFDLDGGRWNLARLRSALAACLVSDGPIKSYELDLPTAAQGTRRIVLNAQRLAYAVVPSSDADSAGGPDTQQPGLPPGLSDIRILLSLADITDARLAERVKDELIRERNLLIQEVQHRVANSLQIIASVLMQSAKRVQSDEVRRHLHDAHHRVMSIASVQDQLATSGLDDVALRPYLTQLCASIGASMIENPDKLALTVRADDVAVPANASVSLGLIVTELVINALKHAFPQGASGRIDVDYSAQAADWTLSVVDTGVGMPVAPEVAESGLGSSIVQALAQQLKATITVTDNRPGTAVAVTHKEPARDGSGPAEMPDTVAI